MSYGIKISVYDGVARIVNHASMELDIPFDDAKALFNELKHDMHGYMMHDDFVMMVDEFDVTYANVHFISVYNKASFHHVDRLMNANYIYAYDDDDNLVGVFRALANNPDTCEDLLHSYMYNLLRAIPEGDHHFEFVSKRVRF